MNALPEHKAVCGNRLRRVIYPTGEPLAPECWKLGLMNCLFRRYDMPEGFKEKFESTYNLPVEEVLCTCGSYSVPCDCR